MTDTFITEYYFWIAIPAQILGFILVYATARHLHDYLNQQAVVMMCAWLWPFTFMLVIVCITVFIAYAVFSITVFIAHMVFSITVFIPYAVFTGIALVVTWLSDKTIGKLMKEQGE